MSPVFLFVVDICLSEEESQALKDSLLQILELIPQNSLVGLITFGTTVSQYHHRKQFDNNNNNNNNCHCLLNPFER
jgi:hypothetical protein